MHVSEASKTRKFKAQVEGATTPFVRIDDETVRFSRPYDKVEITNPGADPVCVELDLSMVRPIEDDTLPFALDDVPVERSSEPYALIELRLSVPEVAEPLVIPPPPPKVVKPRPSFGIVMFTIGVMLCAFVIGMGVVLAVST